MNILWNHVLCLPRVFSSRNFIQIFHTHQCNILTCDPAVNQETGESGRRLQDITLTCGWIEFGADATPTRSRWSSNNYITRVPQRVRVSWSQFVGVRVAIRGSENQLETEDLGPQDPGWAAQQNEGEVLLWPEELGVNMLQFVPSPTHLSHTTLSQPFRIKCERYIFLKKCVCSSLLLIMFQHEYVYV